MGAATTTTGQEPGTVLELIERAAERYGDREALAIKTDEGGAWGWSYRELVRRGRLAAWRLDALGLEPGDRILTWGQSGPELVAAYLGAMRARLVYVPLDLRMSPTAIEGIVKRSGAKHLVLGTGRGAPDPGEVGLERFPTTTLEALTAEPDPDDPVFAPNWEARLDATPRPAPGDVYQLVFTSGTTGTPKGAMIAHEGSTATIAGIHRVVPELHHRLVSVLPLSHLYEQLVGTFYALDLGASILYVRSRSPRQIAAAVREHRTTTLIAVPHVLDLLFDGLTAEVRSSGRSKTFERLRAVARRLPFGLRRLLFRSVHERFLGTEFRLFVSIGAYLPPALQLAWEELGVMVLQGYGSTETAFGTANRLDDRGLGTVGRSVPPFELKLGPDGEILFRGPSLFKGYWQDPEATAKVFDAEGWYHTGDAGRFDPEGRLIITGRTRDMIVLPNGFNVFPEDIENALRDAGLRESIVLETRPGRIEAIVLPPDRPRVPTGDIPSAAPAGFSEPPAELRAEIDGAVKRANATLGINQRIDGWRLWPAADFPRTHTLKVKRDQVKAWVAVEEAARNGNGASGAKGDAMGGSPAAKAGTGAKPGAKRAATRAKA